MDINAQLAQHRQCVEAVVRWSADLDYPRNWDLVIYAELNEPVVFLWRSLVPCALHPGRYVQINAPSTSNAAEQLALQTGSQEAVERFLLTYLRDAAYVLARHEVDEFLRFRGRPLVDPHPERPQPTTVEDCDCFSRVKAIGWLRNALRKKRNLTQKYGGATMSEEIKCPNCDKPMEAGSTCPSCGYEDQSAPLERPTHVEAGEDWYRDPGHRQAYDRGARAGRASGDRSKCPYKSKPYIEAWREGFDRAERDRAEGN